MYTGFYKKEYGKGKQWKQMNEATAHTKSNMGFRKTNHGRDIET
jgi:hypothetical protein